MAASEWATIRFIKLINPGQSSKDLRWPRFEKPYKNLKRQFTIEHTRSCDTLSSRDHLA